MKSHLITIVENFRTSVESKDSDIALQTNFDLLEVQPYERYLLIKGFKLANMDMFYDWAQLLQDSGHDDAKECMIVCLDEIYSFNTEGAYARQFNDDARNGKNLEFITDEIKLILGV